MRPYTRPYIPIILALLVMDPAARADTPSPIPILPDGLNWTSPPPIPGLWAAWMLGTETGDQGYLVRVRLAPDTRIPPHTHPDERITTVLSGTLYVGFGERFEEASLVAVPAGAVYLAPAHVPHYLWARDGVVSYQETGRGPTGTRILGGP